MYTRHVLTSLTVFTASVSAAQELITSQSAAAGVIVGSPAGQEGAAPGGELDFNRLRQLIEQSRKRPELTPGQQRLAVIRELRIDRSTAGILAAQVEDARAKESPAAEVPEEETPAQELERFKLGAQTFRRDVALGRWEKVREFLEAMPEDVKAEVYKVLLQKLASPVTVEVPPELVAQGAKPHAQPVFLPPHDLLGLASASPNAPGKEQMEILAKMLPGSPRPPQEFFAALEKGVRHFGGTAAEDRRRAAALLIETGFVREAGAFLPDLAEAREKKDYAALNLIARHHAELSQRHPKEAGPEAVRQAWEVSTSFLTDPDVPAEARGEALFRALSLIPELGDGKGREWLEKTFENPEGAGLELLASLGTLTARSRENPEPKVRLEQLRLQHAAVQALLGQREFDTAGWSGIFTLFARQWVHEAEVTRQKDQSNTRRMTPRYDEWGNMFFSRPDVVHSGDGVRPITSGELLECQPDEPWLAAIEPAVRNECLLGSARLFLKVKEEDKALPIIGRLAVTHRDEAVSLVREVIKVWSENHNPNSEQDHRSRYFYFYGFNNQSGTIPLTRSKQERNLVELAALVKGIHALDLDESFHLELANAFISCHSRAEVWRVEAVEAVFGRTDALDAPTLAALVGQMRINLAGLWPNPRLQQDYQTKRKDKELHEQLLHGYASAIAVLDRALEKTTSESWRLGQQLASLRFEESNYKSTLAPDNQHSAVKRAALDDLAEAAAGYARTLPLDDPTKETTEVFETWLYAALGSPTLEALKSHHVATPAEYPKIKVALDSLPEETRGRHLKSFASTLNTRLANVAPELKLRYLEAVAATAGGHEALRDAADVLAYYRDLVTEIQLDVAVDGPERVSPATPFGLRVNLRHTREIERESGGFQRYLQNQTGAQYVYNYGRPPEDYRDKFEKAARAVLEEHFEVVSLTFHGDKVESRTDPQFGWRLTPYAYFLLKPKGPQIDRIPPLKIDLDFTDTSGYVVLPVTSPEVPIDASGDAPRPFRELQVAQTLDERSQREDGSLFLEVKATARGLVPPLTELLALEVPGLAVGNIEDRDLRVVELDAQSDDLAPVSEHEWRIELKPDGVLPAKFRFPAVKPEVAAEDGLVLQRYDDVDLLPVTAEVDLVAARPVITPWAAGGLAGFLAILGGWFVIRKRRSAAPPPDVIRLPLPEHINPVSVIGYLRRLQEQPGISGETRASIEAEIAAIEDRHFGRGEATAKLEALEEIALRWQAAA